MATRLVLCILLAFFAYSCTMKSSDSREADSKIDLLIGTYTDSGLSEGIYVYTFDTDSGTLHYKNKTTGIDNPSFLTLSPDQKHIYAVSEWGKDSVGTVYSYRFDSASGELSFLNKQSSGGNGPCYVSTDLSGRYVFTANYGSGSLAAIPIADDGSLGADIQTIYHPGKSQNGKMGPSRMHASLVSPDNEHLFVTNLGTNTITQYPLDEAAESLPLDTIEKAVYTLAEGAGPRHFTFHPNGKYAYAIHELDGQITLFDYQDGALTQKQQVSILPEGFTGKFGAADIHISPDGKFLYGSNRIDLNEIVIFKINQTNGELSFVGRQSSLGKTPRNFAIDPTGKFLIVANQGTNELVVFRRNLDSGLLTETPEKVEIGAPVCLKFVR